jgi:hypothetical protein
VGHAAFTANTTGYYNVGIGSYALKDNIEGYNNSAVGVNSLQNITTGYQNCAIGTGAGQYITGGSTPNETSLRSVYIGVNTKASADGSTNEIVIGYDVTGGGSILPPMVTPL